MFWKGEVSRESASSTSRMFPAEIGSSPLKPRLNSGADGIFCIDLGRGADRDEKEQLSYFPKLSAEVLISPCLDKKNKFKIVRFYKMYSVLLLSIDKVQEGCFLTQCHVKIKLEMMILRPDRR